MVVGDGIEPADSLFVGCGDIPLLCRTIDWSATALGEIAGWPSSLRTVVRMCLDAATIPMAIWAGPELTLIYNQGYADLLGAPTHSLALGHPARAVWSGSWSALGPQLTRVMEHGECVQLEDALLSRFRGADDERVFASSSFVPVRDHRGDVVAALHVVHTSQQSVEEARRASEATARRQLAELETLYETAPIGLCLFDEHLRWVRVNRVIADINGRSIEEHLGKTPSEVVPDVGPQAEAALRTILRTGERLDFEMHGTTSAFPGNERIWSEHWAPIKDPTGRIIGISVAAEEITDRQRAANALAESEERFRTLAENIPQLAWIADQTGSIFWFNRRWYEYTGTTLEEMRGWGWHKVHHPDHVARVVRKISDCFATGEAWEDTFPLRARTGAYRWFLSRATPIRDAAGHIACWLGTNTDITEQLEAEEALRASESRLRKLADAMPHVVWMAGPDGRIDYINERVNELSGVRMLDDGTWAWLDVLVPDDRDATIAAWTTAVQNGTPYEIAHRLVRSDGTVHWYLSRAVPVRGDHDRIVQWFGTATDIDRQKRAEETIREADRHKTDFLSWLSHELRNPIGVIHTSLALIDRAGVASDQGHRALEVIKRQVTQVDRLLQDLLDVARIAKGKILLRRESVELNEVVRTVGEDHRPLFEHQGIQFDVTIADELLRGNVDRVRIVQAVGNLLHNAAKFTSRGGHVVLSLDAAENNAGKIEVRDDGSGIAPEMLGRVFEPFAQDARTIHRSRGLGLGLALVKDLAELHGGTVSAASAGPGAGAVFTMRLPLEVRPISTEKETV
jgi:PAS domain S-box-containing protein